VTANAQCESGLFQASTDLTLRCGEPTSASVFQNGCQRNTNGDYCGLTAAYIGEVNSITSTCESSLTGDCTDDCRSLLMGIRDALGCCVNSFFNESTDHDGIPSLYRRDEFSYALWSNCGVETVTDECTASIVQVRRNDISPDASGNYVAENGNLQCTRKYLEPIVDALRDADGCEVFANGNMEQCGVNESGEHCNTLITELVPLFLKAQSACNETTCDESCEQALMTLRSNGSCCVNTLWNNSLTPISLAQFTGEDSGYPFLSYEFWSDCGLETLELCETKLIDGATYLKASGVITLLLIVVANLAF